MINALMCVYKSADVLKFSVPQLIDCPYITRILIADGPHIGCGNGIPRDGLGPHCESPTIKEYISSISSDKVYYKYTDNLPNRAQKNNDILKHTTKDCKWILCVDSDEVYHEDDLISLVKFLESKPLYDRWRIPTIDLFPDFNHYLKLTDSKCRLYSYKKGYQCRANDDRSHQFVDGKDQRHALDSWRGMGFLTKNVCKLFHLNALRTSRRLSVDSKGNITVKGGNQKMTSAVYWFGIKNTPKSIRESGLLNIENLDGKLWDNLNYVEEK